MNQTLQLTELKQDLASVLVAQGVTAIQAERLAEFQVRCLHRKHQGNRVYWAKGRLSRGMDGEKRKEIYREWYIHGITGKTGEGLLAAHNISITTLHRIIREGRKAQWATQRS